MTTPVIARVAAIVFAGRRGDEARASGLEHGCSAPKHVPFIPAKAGIQFFCKAFFGGTMKMKMSFRFKFLLALAATAAMSSAANAQTIIAQREISLGAARDMAVAAVEHCRKGGFRISVTIVDSGGQTRLFHRDDGAAPHTADASFKKAYTARTYRTPSAEFMKRTEVGGGGRPGLRQINNVLGVPGGLPIKIGDETIGGIGIAGAPGDGDEGRAQAAIDRVADQLK